MKLMKNDENEAAYQIHDRVGGKGKPREKKFTSTNAVTLRDT